MTTTFCGGVAVMCSVIQSHWKCGLSALEVLCENVMSVQDFLLGKRNLRVIFAVIKMICHLVYTCAKWHTNPFSECFKIVI
jgi:hypothetical protein